MNPYREQLISAIQATMFHSCTGYSWFGNLQHELPPSVRRLLTPQISSNYLRHNLQSQLYTDFYCQGFAIPGKPQASDFQESAPDLVRMLSDANSGHGCWEEGWKIQTIEKDKIHVHKGRLSLWVKPEDCFVQDGSILPGLRISLHFPKEFLGMSPSFYMTLSDERLTDSQNQVRFYWNISPKGAVKLMRILTSELNQAHFPHTFKVANDSTGYARCDTAVLYVRKSDYASVFTILNEIYPKVEADLRRGIPCFTKPLAAGVAFAENPRQNESYGFNRCRILAEGMIRAYEQGKKSIEDRLQIVEKHFEEQGISLEKPFLNPGSDEDYCTATFQRPFSASTSELRSPRSESNANTLLGMAVELGRRLEQDAFWCGDRCNWMGSVPPDKGVPDVAFSALGPELYSGTSGVAMFLAELSVATGDAQARITALGAAHQSLSRVDALPASQCLGLYTGWLGVAVAAAHIGHVLGSEKLMESSAQLLRRIRGHARQAHSFDLLSGNAGAIVGLLFLKNLFDDDRLLDFAIRLGDKLLRTAKRSNVGYSWKSTGLSTLRNLTGFSHGTAGVGYALLELFHASGNEKYRKAADQAFNYERHWFDAETSNWPDFRCEASWRKRSAPQIFGTSWCHGAPGIALSRLRAYEILKDDKCKDEAMIALRTTRRIVELHLQSQRGNFSLCHGLAGNAEVLFLGYGVLGESLLEESRLVLSVADAGIKRYSEQSQMSRYSTVSAENPNLMLGLAGIGLFYLRLYNSKTPSVLLLQAEKTLRNRALRESIG